MTFIWDTLNSTFIDEVPIKVAHGFTASKATKFEPKPSLMIPIAMEQALCSCCLSDC